VRQLREAALSVPTEGDAGWLVRLASLRIDARWDAAVRNAGELRAAAPKATDDELATVLVDDAASFAALIGVGIGAGATIPLVGQFIAAAGAPAELVYMTGIQFDVALSIAAIYRPSLTKEALLPILLACLTFSMGQEFVKELAKESAVTLSKRAIEELFKGAVLVAAKRLARNLGIAATKKGLLNAVPLLAIPVGSAMNYAGVLAFGKVAKHYFSPNWQSCSGCGHIQPRKNRFCAGCAVPLANDREG
jgi:hypothetical protein